MSRQDIFEVVRASRGGKAWLLPDIAILDQALDRLGVPLDQSGSTMKASPEAAKLMHEFEGCELAAYPDPGSKDGNPWTIGRGATGPGIHKGVVWTQQQADARFAEDVARFSKGVAEIIGDSPTTQYQFDALTSFAYNVGLSALKSSTLMKLHKAGDYQAAAGQFARWDKNDGVVMRGLTRRRAAEAKMYRGEA